MAHPLTQCQEGIRIQPNAVFRDLVPVMVLEELQKDACLLRLQLDNNTKQVIKFIARIRDAALVCFCNMAVRKG
jgi:hypothetical protein